jgi:hypothetical protein
VSRERLERLVGMSALLLRPVRGAPVHTIKRA